MAILHMFTAIQLHRGFPRRVVRLKVGWPAGCCSQASKRPFRDRDRLNRTPGSWPSRRILRMPPTAVRDRSTVGSGAGPAARLSAQARMPPRRIVRHAARGGGYWFDYGAGDAMYFYRRYLTDSVTSSLPDERSGVLAPHLRAALD